MSYATDLIEQVTKDAWHRYINEYRPGIRGGFAKQYLALAILRDSARLA